jgi:hypothetical protein
MENKEWDEADTSLKAMEKFLPEGQQYALATARFDLLMNKEDYKGAAKYAGEVSDAQKDNAQLQNKFAWDLLTHEGIKDRDLVTAEKIAARANDASDGKEPAIMDTLARAWFMQGKKDKAIELQEKAVKLAEDDAKEQLQRTLNSYKDGKLPAAE